MARRFMCAHIWIALDAQSAPRTCFLFGYTSAICFILDVLLNECTVTSIQVVSISIGFI